MRFDALLVAAGLLAGCGASDPDLEPCVATSLDPRRYKLVDTGPITWSAARTECQRHGYDLVVLDSDAEYNRLLLGVATGYGPWAGHSDLDREGRWTSINGCRPSLRWGRFVDQEPNGGTLENCAALGHDGGDRTVLLDAPCDGDVIESAMCEQMWSDDPACGPAASALDRDRYVAVVDMMMDETTAVARCTALGMHPIVFDSAEEYDFIRGIHTALDFWIGITDRAVEGQWVSATGCPPFLLWAPAEPRDELVDEDCAASAADGVYDRPCTELRYVVCESG